MPPLYPPQTSGAGISESQAAIAAMTVLASDGSDGDITISGTTTLTRDMQWNNVTIGPAGILICRGWAFTFRTLLNNGVIHWDGNAASGATAGSAYTGGSMPPNLVGVAGVVAAAAGANGTASAALPLPRSGSLGAIYRGGAGGASVGGANAGGAGGVTTLLSVSRSPRRNVLTGLTLVPGSTSVTLPTGGSSGGAGAGDGTSAGGGSGSGGGVGLMVGGSVTNNGVIGARGGAGGAAAGGNAGGGGGGGGGVIIATVGLWTGNLPDVSGGAAGVGAGSGSAGSAGSLGEYFINQYKAA